MIEKEKRVQTRHTQEKKEKQYVCVAPPILITHKSLRQKKTLEVEQKNKLSCVRHQ
jgi:hypothetical protein